MCHSVILLPRQSAHEPHMYAYTTFTQCPLQLHNNGAHNNNSQYVTHGIIYSFMYTPNLVMFTYFLNLRYRYHKINIIRISYHLKIGIGTHLFCLLLV